jgi:hypothetical protein
VPAKPESNFIERVHGRLPKSIYREKMSNPYRSGTPDCWYSGQRDLWIEYKYAVLPKRPGTYIDFDVSPLQRRWIESRRLEGRDVWLVVGCSVGGGIFKVGFPDGMACITFKGHVITIREVAQSIYIFCNEGRKNLQTEEGRSLLT